MTKIILASTWNPRGELPRLQRLLPQLEAAYAHLVIVLGAGSDPQVLAALQQDERLAVFLVEDWSVGRYTALQKALEAEGEYIHYVDMDRLLRWVETRPDEWQQAVAAIPKVDCLIFGRTEAATQTHPRALVETEQISNQVVSHLLGREMDVSAGAKGFSRAAAAYLVAQARPAHALGADGEWTVLLQRAGFTLDYLEVDGLDWESADQFRERAATAEEQRQVATQYDADLEHWSYRVQVALEVVAQGLQASQRVIPSAASAAAAGQPDFDFAAVFNPDDYLYYYADALTEERTEKEVAALVPLLELEQPMRILDLACGFGRHTNRLAALGHSLVGVDLMEGFLAVARQEAEKLGVQVDYRQGDMRRISFEQEFDRVTLLFTAFGYFEDDENLLVLQNAARALKPGGLLIFDTNNRDTLLRNFHPAFVHEKDGNLLIDRMSFDSLTGRMQNRRILIRDGVRKDMPFFVRLYNPSEIRPLLAQAGLELYKVYGDWGGQPLSPESRRMVIIAKKSTAETPKTQRKAMKENSADSATLR